MVLRLPPAVPPQPAGWVAAVTSGEIAFQVLAPSVDAQTRHVPKYRVVGVLGSITSGGIKLPRSAGLSPELARKPLPRIPSPLKVTRMNGNGGWLGIYSHSP